MNKKQKRTILGLITLLGLLIPMSAFALNTMALKEVTRSYMVESDDYKAAQRAAVYVPVTEFFEQVTLNNLDRDGVTIDDLAVTTAFAVGDKDIVKNIGYVKPDAYSDYEYLDPDAQEIGKYGYIRFQLAESKVGAGKWANIRVAFDIPNYNSALTYLDIVIEDNPNINPIGGKIAAPKNLNWDTKTLGRVSWEHVKDAAWDNADIHKYVVKLIRTRGDNIDILSTQVISINKGTTTAEHNFSAEIQNAGPGKYKFQVAALGNATDIDNPQGYYSLSKEWEYKLPSATLSQAKALNWVREMVGGEAVFLAKWSAPSNFKYPDYYQTFLYKDGVQIAPLASDREGYRVEGTEEQRFSDLVRRSGDGRYTFKVQAMTGRPLEINSGELSLVSNVLEVKDGVIYIDGKTQYGKIDQAALKLTANPGKINVLTETTLNVSGGSTKGKVTFSIVGGTGSASINGNKLLATKPGTIRVQARMDGLLIKDKDYNAVDSNIVEIVAEVAPVALEGKVNGTSVVLTIPDKKIQELIDVAPFQEHGAAVITPSKKGNATAIAVPEKALDKLAKSSKVKGVAIQFGSGARLRLNDSALDFVLKQARGEYIVFNVREIKSGDKTIKAAQKLFLDSEKPARIYEVSMTSDGRQLYTKESENKGTLYFSFPYTPKDINAMPKMFFIDDNANLEEAYTDYKYSVGEVVSEFTHLSIYFLREGAATGGSGKSKLMFETGGGSTIKAVEVEQDKVVQLSGYKTVRTGYVFAGWYEDAQLTKPISRVKVTGDTVVYAKWNALQLQTGFSDVPYSAWYRSAIDTMLKYDIMGGVSATQFAPNRPTTRAMIVTMLYRLEGSPEVKRSSSFADVKDQAYYKNAVAWAASNKIVKGYGENKFGPNDSITREQMAAILKSYSTYKKYNTTASARISQFRDFNKVSGYAVESVEWAVGEQLIGGKGNGLLDPKGKATRAEVASIFQRYLEAFA